MQRRSQQIELNPNNKQSHTYVSTCRVCPCCVQLGLSSFKVGLDNDEWRTYVDIKREFNAVKYDAFDWCKELSQNASKNAIHNLGDAVTRWQKGQNNFPTYKKRSDRISYQADNGTGTVEVYKNRINLPKIGWVRMREELRYTGRISKVVVSKRNNRWFVSILIDCDISNFNYQTPSV